MTATDIRLLNRETDSVLALQTWNRAATFDQMSLELFNEKVWSDSDVPDEGRLAAVARGDIVGLCVAAARKAVDGPHGYVKLLAVAPDHQRRGIGVRLLNRAEELLAAHRCTTVRIAESAPNYLTPGVDLRYEAANSFFQASGYQPFSEAVNMIVRLRDNELLSSLLTHRTPARYRIELATANDQPQAIDFLKQHWPAWQGEVLAAFKTPAPPLCLAWQGDLIVGFGAYECNNRGTGWFGPMGVAPAARGSGLGRLLLARCLEDMQQQGFQDAIIPWVGPTEFYVRTVGATIDRRFNRFEKALQA